MLSCVNYIIKKKNKKKADESTNNVESSEILPIYVHMHYYSDKGLWLLKPCLCRIRSNCVKTRSIRFKTQYDVNKIEFYCNNKDKTVVLNNLFVVADFSCHGCGANYTGKTELILYERTVEHASSAPIPNTDKFDLRTARINLVQHNTEIIDRNRNWNDLLLKEALKIKELNPILNSGLKACKALQLF